jgi:hypothetical protein
MRRVECDAADRGEPAHQVDAAVDVRARQTKRITRIAMRNVGPRRRTLQARAPRQQIAVDHHGMRVDPGRVGERCHIGKIA